MFRQDPGLCPICGAAHAACTADAGPITVTQLPARDALAAAALAVTAQSVEPPAELAPAVVDPVPAPFSTSEYKRATHGPRARR